MFPKDRIKARMDLVSRAFNIINHSSLSEFVTTTVRGISTRCLHIRTYLSKCLTMSSYAARQFSQMPDLHTMNNSYIIDNVFHIYIGGGSGMHLICCTFLTWLLHPFLAFRPPLGSPSAGRLRCPADR